MRRLRSFRIANLLRNRRQPLTVLACVAMLLLLVMPTTGRLLGRLAPDVHGTGHAMVMTDGVPMAMPGNASHTPEHAGDAGHARHPAAPDGNGQYPDHGSCPYCPLLGSVIAFSPCVAVAAAVSGHDRVPPARHLAYVTAPHRGLGARGPPTLL